jgi:tRNA 2-thiocytidine biosynthesis protein TtcA
MNEKINLSYWQKRHVEHVKNQVSKAIMEFGMIDNGDKVLAAVSGGKDSLVMLEALAAFRRFNKVDFHLEALHMEVEDVPYEVDRDFLSDYADSLDVPLHYKNIKAGLEKRGKKAPCFVCSWHRRKNLFEFARNNGFQKLALGHHMDDAVETLLMNMAYHGHISSLPGKLRMFDGALYLIRPLLLLTDKDTQAFAKLRDFPALVHECPYADTTKRSTARELMESLEKIHPKASFNLFRSMQNIDEEYLPGGLKDDEN